MSRSDTISNATSGPLPAPSASQPSSHAVVIEPPKGWQLVDWRELSEYRDLFYFLVWRDIKSRYAQSVLGIGWAIIPPVITMITFTIIFGKLAKLDSDGVPYPIFSFAALAPWTFFAASLTGAAGSVANNKAMVTKIYFPRLVLPMSAVLGKLLDFAITMTLLCVLMLWYRTPPTFNALLLPLLVGIMMLAASGLGMWLAAMSVQYRDLRFAMGYVVQLLMYATPVVYSVSIIPDRFQLYYAINPMVGVVEGFRASLLGTRDMPWDLIAVGAAASVVLFISGAFVFRRMETRFADLA